MNAELILFFTSFHPYSPFACLRWNDYKQTYCTTDSLLIVPPPMKCSAIWHMDKWGRLMANKEHHSFSPTRFGQKTNVFNQIYMFRRNIGCWKFANSWIFPPTSLPCRNYILPGWFMDGTVWVLFLLCLVFAHLIETSKIKGCWCWGDRRGGMAMCGSTNSLKIQEYSCFNSLTMNHAKQLSEENTQLLSMKQLKHQWKVCLQHSFIFLRKMKDLWIASLNNYAVTG